MGESVIAEGAIQLPVTIEEAPDQVTSIVDFLVADFPFIYSTIVGRPLLNLIKAVIPMYTLAIKFPIRSKVCTAKRKQ